MEFITEYRVAWLRAENPNGLGGYRYSSPMVDLEKVEKLVNNLGHASNVLKNSITIQTRDVPKSLPQWRDCVIVKDDHVFS